MAVLALFAARPAGAAAPNKAFVSDHCAGCHNETDTEGRLDYQIWRIYLRDLLLMLFRD